MRIQSHMLNDNPLRCDAYHEAGHAVIGLLHGMRLKYASIRPPGGLDPHCRWDDAFIDPIVTTGTLEARRAFVAAFAEVSLASRHSEAIICTMSDEQNDAHAGDLGDAQKMCLRAGLAEFTAAEIERVNARAGQLVHQHTGAITAIAEKLYVAATLTQQEIEAILEANQTVNRRATEVK
jgi:hypothetical protein